MKDIYRWIIFIFVVGLISSCGGGSIGTMSAKISESMAKMPASELQQLDDVKIFWGHQSVGANILEGMKELLSAHSQIPLKVIKVDEPYKLTPGVLSHVNVGKNGDPSSKIIDFVRMVDDGVGNQADLAFFKFCFIDLNDNSDVKKEFEEYRTALQSLKEKYTRTRFMHATIPLLTVQSGPKAWVKKILGRTPAGTSGNAKRCEFNDLVRAEYDGIDPIFDIAKAQSTRPDGSRESFVLAGKTYFAVVPAYTSDGGHLNKLGSMYLASELLALLVDVFGRTD